MQSQQFGRAEAVEQGIFDDFVLQNRLFVADYRRVVKAKHKQYHRDRQLEGAAARLVAHVLFPEYNDDKRYNKVFKEQADEHAENDHHNLTSFLDKLVV
jgi:hypothetical protein